MRDRLLALIDGLAKVRVLCFVDLIADEYIYGQISRVSREAPVLILDYDDTRVVPGGGGNAVNNLAALGGRAITVGIVGKDQAGREVLASLRKANVNVDVSAVRRDGAYRTPMKTRILAGGVHAAKQQVVRIDRKTRVKPTKDIARHLDSALKKFLPKADVVMVSDYDFGLITPEFGNALARRAASMRKPAVLDSR